MVEALTDPKTWLFALFTVFSSIPGSLNNQLQIIIASFGFNMIQTTLLSCVSGVVIIVAILTCATIASRTPNSIAWVGMAVYVLDILGAFLVNFLPWDEKVGLLFSVWINCTLLVPRRVDSSNPGNQLLGPRALCYVTVGCRKRRLGIRRELRRTPSCYPRSALAMLQGPSCGKINISLGKSLTSPPNPTATDMIYLAIMFPG